MIGKKMFAGGRRFAGTPSGAWDSWWDAPSNTCVGAWAAKGAASEAASYQDLTANNNDLTENGTVSWNATDGWTGWTGSNYLDTGIDVAASGWSMIVRYTNCISNWYRCIAGTTAGGATIFALYAVDQNSNVARWKNGSDYVHSAKVLAGTTCIAGDNAYLDGSSVGSVAGASWSGTNAHNILIGAFNNSGSVTHEATSAKIQAAAIYSDTLSAADVAALTTNIDAL